MKERDLILKKLNKGWCRIFWECLPCTEIKYNFNGRRIYGEKAPDPSDLIWENIGLSPTVHQIKKLVTVIISFLMMGAAFAAIIGLNVLQVNLSKMIYFFRETLEEIMVKTRSNQEDSVFSVQL